VSRVVRRIVALVFYLAITLGLLVAVPKVWADVRAGDPALVAAAVPLEVLSVLGSIVLFWAVYRSLADEAGTGVSLGLGDSMRLVTSRLALGATLPGGAATGFAVQFWALSRSGMSAADISRGTTAFLVLSNSVAAVVLIVLGLALSLESVPGHVHLAFDIPAAATAAAAVVGVLALARAGRRAKATGRAPQTGAHVATTGRLRQIASRIAPGTHDAIVLLRRPWALAGLIANPLFDLMAFYLAYWSVAEPQAIAVMVFAYFLGQAGSLIPVPGAAQVLAIACLVASGATAADATAGVLVWTAIVLSVQIGWGLYQYVALRRAMRAVA
jgi:uncharacterized membrane protein YbhN (UPF0104 family)